MQNDKKPQYGDEDPFQLIRWRSATFRKSSVVRNIACYRFICGYGITPMVTLVEKQTGFDEYPNRQFASL
jgi:hypothetical protein